MKVSVEEKCEGACINSLGLKYQAHKPKTCVGWGGGVVDGIKKKNSNEVT